MKNLNDLSVVLKNLTPLERDQEQLHATRRSGHDGVYPAKARARQF